MHLKGTIVEWKDDRGFGFIEPSSGGERVFCHIKAFAVRVRRPMAGDTVTYRSSKDAKGRLQAIDVRPAGLERAAYNSKSTSSRVRTRDMTRSGARGRSSVAACAFIALFAAALVALLIMQRINFFVPLIYIAMSGVTLMAYAFDKSAAMNRRGRTREQTLHLFELLGGWPGGLIAQDLFHHKSRKTTFLIEFWICVGVNLVALVIHSGLVRWELN